MILGRHHQEQNMAGRLWGGGDQDKKTVKDMEAGADARCFDYVLPGLGAVDGGRES